MCNLRYAQLQNHKRQHHDAQSPVVVIIDIINIIVIGGRTCNHRHRRLDAPPGTD